MNKALQGIWNKLEANKTEALNRVEPNTSFRPESGWSPLQALEHLLTSEQGVLRYCQKKTLAPAIELPLKTEENKQRSRHLNNRLKSDERYERPQGLPSPSGDKSLAEYAAHWQSLRDDWKQFLDEIPAEYHDRLVFKHPFAGRLSLGQTLEFMTNHIAHHFRQLDGNDPER